MIELLEEAKEKFNISNLNAKLWRRFWQAINMYRNGKSYQEIITLLNGSRKGQIKQPRWIYNTVL